MISGMRVRRRSSAGGKKGYRFYRLWIDAVAGTGSNHRPIIADLFLVGPSTPTGVPSGGVASASTLNSGSSADNAFDNDPLTSWSALLEAPAAPPWWLQYEFAETVELTEYRIRAHYVNGNNFAPRIFQFQASTNGSTWDTLDTQTNQTGWTDNELRTFPL